ncbi:GvpL/GvpF family gas vesicle protein [Natronosporangium hydrolyticum]|uniref:GvpL/GvpF family gas vesicle protein n=1 Tax=Natronosporangium hydrolyticum TaxID=2811111 RepID=A0A895YBP3_9ACTN|nr:GvpL/GvpF family gas vesicle protein [Natronosporangium hydrolyticum]QSB15187.1 GvpL/GvpF family gas vesicle protein [Natronosporangium hydrolyticum]
MTAAGSASHLYGVVWADAADGALAGLPGDAVLVPYQRLAAITRPTPAKPDRRLRPQLLGYTATLDSLARHTPVLPVRFGTTFATTDDVITEFLAPGHDAYASALTSLATRNQFTVRARYRGDAPVREVLAEQPATRALHQRVRHAPRSKGADQAARVRLGEQVAQAVGAKRSADIDTLTQWLRPYQVLGSVSPARSVEGDRIADVACLVERARAAEFEAAVAELGAHWRGRARLRLLGPMAPYDFAAGLVNGEYTLDEAGDGRAPRWPVSSGRPAAKPVGEG